MNKQKLFKSSPKFFKLKTATVFLTLVVFLFLTIPALALETGLQYGTYTGLGTQDLRISIMKIVRIILGFVGFIALLLTLYGGFIWMTSAGNAEKIAQAKKILVNAAIGLAIILSAFAIVSYIIFVLQGGTFGPGPGPTPGPLPCENCGHLGTGIIESVYPTPNQRDVFRNTSITVTFKVTMDPSSVIDDTNSNGTFGDCVGTPPVCDNLKSGSVLIYQNSAGESGALAANTVRASVTNGNRTFNFYPNSLLGDGANNIWYAVKLTNAIKKDNGDSAFPGAAGNFTWRFEVGSLLDLDPVQVSNVFPAPDKLGDTYSTNAAIQATGSITVGSAAPKVAREATTTPPVILAGTTNAKVSGSYNGSFTGRITVTINNTTPMTANVFWSTGNINNIANAPISGGAIVLGGGLTLVLDSGFGTGNQWGIDVVAAQVSDTLRIDNKTYTFVARTAAASGSQINVGSLPAGTATNITDKINGDNLGITASASGTVITLTAKIAGKAGNLIPLSASGSWATIETMTGGADAGLGATTKDKADQPRNAIITIDFNEPIDISQVSADTIKVEYQDTAGNWQAVDGTFEKSNLNKTVNFFSEATCGVCSNGDPCSIGGAGGNCSDGGICKTITNSCNEEITCLPVNNPTPYVATHYRVTIKAGWLKECTTNSDCSDANFNSCVATTNGSACQGTFGSVTAFYPEVRVNPQGITDMAKNSFNGNKDTYTLNNKTYGRAEGPKEQSNQDAYNLTTPADNTGDDLVWEFYINKSVNLSAAKITEIGPKVADTGVSLTAPPQATFDRLMLSSTLKPGSNYKDGQCYCDHTSTTNNKCPTGQVCDITNKCKSTAGEQPWCLEDKECPKDNRPANQCVNKKYVTLIDQTTSPVGWWVTNVGLDTFLPLDNYSDQTKALLNHTKFSEITSYGSEAGSGIKDIYQNCYLPSEGPASDTCNPATGAGCCGVNSVNAYCCNGSPSDQPCSF